MKKSQVVGGTLAVAAVLLGVAAFRRAAGPTDEPVAEHSTGSVEAAAPEAPPAVRAPAGEGQQGFLYGRVTTVGGGSFEGRLRWGRREEAFWSDTFNGRKDGNPWVAHVPPERLPRERRTFELFGLEFGGRERPVDLGRLFMARFGDIARIDASTGAVRVTLKSGTVFVLDRNEASDIDDDVRVWDVRRGVVDLNSRRIVAIELLPTARLDAAPARLHGTVRTRQGDFTGFVQWDREACVGSDELNGRTDAGEVRLRFDTIRSIARRSASSAAVTTVEGREVVLSGTRDAGHGNRGIYVEDRRYGRVLVSWDAFERVDFSPGGGGPAYSDFPPGRPLSGRFTTRAGRALAGRLVFDLDESETTETLDAPSRGVDYTIPFGRIASVVPDGGAKGEAAGVAVTLHGGETLSFEPAGDVGSRNAGMLVFVDGGKRPEYVPWADVARIDFDVPADAPPPAGRRSGGDR